MVTLEFDATQQKRYIDKKMGQVSRSFALVVQFLESPLDLWISTAYLICRVIDNVEDCTQTAAWKESRFEEVRRLLEAPQEAAQVLTAWDRMAWPGLTKDERSMMGVQEGLSLWQTYGGMPDHARHAVNRWAGEMSRGMAAVEDPWDEPQLVQRDRVRVLSRVHDYDRYCYYVAGTVGYMSTELVNAHYEFDKQTAEQLLAHCEACGRALQKTNIVKDFAKDLSRGISFLPDEWMKTADYSPLRLDGAPIEWKAMVIDNVIQELRSSVDYVLTLPYEAKGFRLASLMCMLPAYETILLAAKRNDILFTERHRVKISRLNIAQCVKDAHRMLNNDAAIVEYGRSMDQQIGIALGIPAPIY